MQSAWTPTDQELAALNKGGSVMLGISSAAHPVVQMGVTDAPDRLELCPISHIAVGSPHANDVIVWDDALDKPCDLDCVEVDVAEGWVVFYPKGADGSYVMKDDKPVTERRAGAFSLKWSPNRGSNNPAAKD
jgi:hypothetical protein